MIKKQSLLSVPHGADFGVNIFLCDIESLRCCLSILQGFFEIRLDFFLIGQAYFQKAFGTYVLF